MSAILFDNMFKYATHAELEQKLFIAECHDISSTKLLGNEFNYFIASGLKWKMKL